MLPTQNPILLLSIINTKLRDNYSSLDELLDDLSITKDELDTILNSAGYYYNEYLNQYK